MIEHVAGNILQDTADAILNPVNCVGVMGKGLALQFKTTWPANYRAYAAACRRGDVQAGRLFVFETGLTPTRYVVNFPTKRHWRDPSRMEDVVAGLATLRRWILAHEVTSVAIPPLGSGLGGLAWPDVRREIETALDGVTDVHVRIYAPWTPEPANERGRSFAR